MKNVFFLLLLCFLSQSIIAQIEQGGWLLGGDFSFQRNSQKLTDINENVGNTITSDPNSTVFSFQAEVGYLLKNNMAVGLTLGYNYTDSERVFLFSSSFSEFVTQVDKQNLYSIGPYLKYYYPFKNEKIGFYLEMLGQYGWGSSELDTNNPSFTIITDDIESDLIELNIGITPGLYYFVTPRIYLDASLGGFGYTFQKKDLRIFRNSGGVVGTQLSMKKEKNSDFNLFLIDGIGARIGISLFFGKRTNEN